MFARDESSTIACNSHVCLLFTVRLFFGVSVVVLMQTSSPVPLGACLATQCHNPHSTHETIVCARVLQHNPLQVIQLIVFFELFCSRFATRVPEIHHESG